MPNCATCCACWVAELHDQPSDLIPRPQRARGTAITLLGAAADVNQVMPLRAVYLFGSHARGDARPDSDVDLCLVAEGAERQLEAAQGFARVIRPIRPKPSFTLVPITPERLAEKRSVQDYFLRPS